MLALFVLALFFSSALMFIIEPMFAKMVLPKFGGTPVVWNTCLVFFQATLLAGYAYAHLITRHFKVRHQVLIHTLVLLTPLAVLPVIVPAMWASSSNGNPLAALLSLLVVGVGLPFFVVSTSGPLLQRWFSASGHHQARDPYFLYAASNMGSIIGLLAYPVVMEPLLRVADQSLMWTVGYGALVLFSIASGIAALVGARRTELSPALVSSSTANQPHLTEQENGGTIEMIPPSHAKPLSWLRRLRWMLLAAVPSSLMLGLTLHLTTDIAPVPLLWVIPLAAYLLSFIVVFSRKPVIPHSLSVRIMPMILLLLAMLLAMQADQPMWLVLPLHVVTFFVVALVCHGELAADRPDPAHLTEFYLLMSVGGVIGGIFNALLAPLIFSTVTEYPLAIVLACLLHPGRGNTNNAKTTPGTRARVLDFVWPTALATLAVGMSLLCEWLRMPMSPIRNLITAGLPAAICFMFMDRPIRFSLGVGAVLLVGSFTSSQHGRLLHGCRSFFGVHSVRRLELDEAARLSKTGLPVQPIQASQYGPGPHHYNVLLHGTTIHGMQWVDPATGAPIRPQEGLMYYHPHGPIGEVMLTLLKPGPQTMPAGEEGKMPGSNPTTRPTVNEVAIVGMGAGTLAAYSQPGQHFTFYEIDPLVEDLAVRSGHFTYILEARKRGTTVDVVLGDARLTLQNAADQSVDLLILDAFSSDSIPLHLMTWEAMQLYRRKLASEGVLAWHISNNYLDLQPVVAALADKAGLKYWVCADMHNEKWMDDYVHGRAQCVWVLLAKNEDRVQPIVANKRWKLISPKSHQVLWTDDFTNIISVFKWQGADDSRK